MSHSSWSGLRESGARSSATRRPSRETRNPRGSPNPSWPVSTRRSGVSSRRCIRRRRRALSRRIGQRDQALGEQPPEVLDRPLDALLQRRARQRADGRLQLVQAVAHLGREGKRLVLEADRPVELPRGALDRRHDLGHGRHRPAEIGHERALVARAARRDDDRGRVVGEVQLAAAAVGDAVAAAGRGVQHGHRGRRGDPLVAPQPVDHVRPQPDRRDPVVAPEDARVALVRALVDAVVRVGEPVPGAAALRPVDGRRRRRTRAGAPPRACP